jgi:hypothetical protein
MKLPAVPLLRDGVSWAELRRSPTRLRSHELRRGRLTIPLSSPAKAGQSILAKANEGRQAPLAAFESDIPEEGGKSS